MAAIVCMQGIRSKSVNSEVNLITLIIGGRAKQYTHGRYLVYKLLLSTIKHMHLIIIIYNIIILKFSKYTHIHTWLGFISLIINASDCTRNVK